MYKLLSQKFKPPSSPISLVEKNYPMVHWYHSGSDLNPTTIEIIQICNLVLDLQCSQRQDSSLLTTILVNNEG